MVDVNSTVGTVFDISCDTGMHKLISLAVAKVRCGELITNTRFFLANCKTSLLTGWSPVMIRAEHPALVRSICTSFRSPRIAISPRFALLIVVPLWEAATNISFSLFTLFLRKITGYLDNMISAIWHSCQILDRKGRAR